jgi:hypothetical protein
VPLDARHVQLGFARLVTMDTSLTVTPLAVTCVLLAALSATLPILVYVLRVLKEPSCLALIVCLVTPHARPAPGPPQVARAVYLANTLEAHLVSPALATA